MLSRNELEFNHIDDVFKYLFQEKSRIRSFDITRKYQKAKQRVNPKERYYRSYSNNPEVKPKQCFVLRYETNCSMIYKIKTEDYTNNLKYDLSKVIYHLIVLHLKSGKEFFELNVDIDANGKIRNITYEVSYSISPESDNEASSLTHALKKSISFLMRIKSIKLEVKDEGNKRKLQCLKVLQVFKRSDFKDISQLTTEGIRENGEHVFRKIIVQKWVERLIYVIENEIRNVGGYYTATFVRNTETHSLATDKIITQVKKDF